MFSKKVNTNSNSKEQQQVLKNQYEAVVYFLQHLDSHMLDLILDETYQYQDFDKKTFIQKMSNVLTEYQESGDTFLKAYEGKCISKICDNTHCTGFSFVGNTSGQYMDLILQVKEGAVWDIFECYHFENQQKNLIKKGKVSIDSQEMPF